MGYALLIIFIFVPIMSFVWLLVSAVRKSKEVKRLEADKHVLIGRYNTLADKVVNISEMDPLEMTPHIYRLAKNIQEQR